MAGQQSDMVQDSQVLDPGLPIIDPHHHLGYLYGGRYLVEELAADIATGHDVRATVYVECSAMYRQDGPPALQPVGEAEFVAGMAAMGDSGQFGPARICTGFVGAADLTLGAAVDEVLDALATASGGRLRGLRGSAIWDANETVNTGTRPFAPHGLLLDPQFRAGFARLAPRGLVYDAFQYHPQTPDLCSLADAFPDTVIVVNHCGGLLGIGPYDRTGGFAGWKHLIADAAKRPNVLMKLGGLAARRCGFGFEARERPATAAELAALWGPYFETCIELFGPQRCMFESNFPPDRHAGDYATLWNTFKLVAAGCSASEKAALFSGTARRIYRVDGWERQ